MKQLSLWQDLRPVLRGEGPGRAVSTWDGSKAQAAQAPPPPEGPQGPVPQQSSFSPCAPPSLKEPQCQRSPGTPPQPPDAPHPRLSSTNPARSRLLL